MERALQVLRTVEDLQAKHEISIIKLSEPISSAFTQDAQANNIGDTAAGTSTGTGTGTGTGEQQQQQQQRTSDVSNSSLDAPTPASLEADLAHYRELFAKLRFSYVEQVTKEKFIRAIVGDPPLIVSARDNAELEAANGAAKARLKARKSEVAAMVADLETRGRDLARRHARVVRDTAALRDLPANMAALEAAIADLRAAAQGGHGDTDADADADTGADGDAARRRRELRLPLARTETLVAERRARAAELDRQLEQLAAQAPRKRKEAERLQLELAPLEAKRQNSAAAAREARRRKDAALGSRVEDDLEERGRWWRASEAALREMLDIQG